MNSDWYNMFTTQALTALYFAQGVNSYSEEFLRPLMSATANFTSLEAERFFSRSPKENLDAYGQLLKFNLELLTRLSQGTCKSLGKFNQSELQNLLSTWNDMLQNPSGEAASNYMLKNQQTLQRVMEEYPKAIKEIEPEYGFHFEKDKNSYITETDRFILRKVAPADKGVKTDDSLKPILIIPPFVLGANILAFLPGEKKSYAHSYANKGIPTYIRILKPIDQTPAVQVMTAEEDALDTKMFCEKIKAEHNQEVTLNGYCQGGFSSICNILSGKLDGLVDALITCVTPVDGTRSKGLGSFLKNLPDPFNDLAYGTKTLSNGNKIADGNLMGWIYKLKSIEQSAPLVSFFNDIAMLSATGDRPIKISKTVAALNFWLQNERSDLPLPITEMSFRSYNNPITEDGTLPVKLFGKKLNLKAIEEKKIQWLLCYGESDDLVEKEVALAPLDYLNVEVTPFPKGHVAIATSWSHPESLCSLDSRFGEKQARGPVRFQLDLSGK